MFVTPSIDETRAFRWQDPRPRWGLVPTMGALHEGHLSLIRRARAETDRVAVTIYVNPTQFGAGEDLSSYPRPLARDLDLLAAEGVDLVFTPDDRTMYPTGFQTAVEVRELTQKLEGRSRPSHFAGVTLIVAKLFNILQPQVAYFGQKDAQQTVVLGRMVQDLNFNLSLVVCPTVRDERGLALSSRNAYLSPAEYEAALSLNQSLSGGAAAVREGLRDAGRLRQAIVDRLAAEPLARIDYVSVADLETLDEVTRIEGKTLVSLAVFIGTTRLIDNAILDPEGDPSS